MFGPRQVSEQVNNNSSAKQYPGSKHRNAKSKVIHHTRPPTQRLRPPRYSFVKTLLTIEAVPTILPLRLLFRAPPNHPLPMGPNEENLIVWSNPSVPHEGVASPKHRQDAHDHQDAQDECNPAQDPDQYLNTVVFLHASNLCVMKYSSTILNYL